MGALKLGLVAVVLVVLGFAAYVRLAPSDPARWHDDPVAGQRPKDWGGTPEPLGQGAVMLTQLGSARSFSQHTLAPADLLARLDAIALGTPRTTRLSGSAQSGRITWVTRSALWGFPDYITATATEAPEGSELLIFARLRFGEVDLGVNAARLRQWLVSLSNTNG